jgi:hypothetical protein
MHVGVASGKYSPAGASQCYGGIDPPPPPPPPPPPGEGEEDLPVAFWDLDASGDGCISEDEFHESDPPPNLAFVTVVSTVSNDGCPEEISEADFNALMQQMQGGGTDLGGDTDPGGDPGTGLTECSCADAENLRSEIEMLKQQVANCSSFIPTGNLTMPWGKSGYSHCQLLFSWTELMKVLSFIRFYPILSPFFVYYTSCFIDDSDLYPILSLSSHCTFFVCTMCFIISIISRGTKSVILYSRLEVSVIVCRKICTRAGCAWSTFAVILSSAGSIMR